MRRLLVLAIAAACLATASLSPASGDEVTVSVTNPGGSRTLYVETLLGQPLTSLDFGTGRSQPFRVRVVDATMDRSGFQVLTTMSNLYKVSGNSYDWDSKVAASDVAVSYPPNPLNLLDAKAVVTPVYNMTETLTGALCTTVQTAGGSCSIVLTGVEGLRKTVDLAVTLADLNSLPLVPQTGEEGRFLSADYAGIGANDPNKPGTFTPTNRRVISGAVSTATTTLNSVSSALQAVVAGQPADSLVDEDALAGALRDALGGPVFDALLPSVVADIVSGLQTTVQAVTAADIVGQSGTYLSYPKLDVTVPESASPGSYQGTLVVTAVQL